MFHFGWFVGKGYSPHGWNQPWTGTIGSDWMQPDIYMDLARGLERACCPCYAATKDTYARVMRASPVPR